MVNLIILDDSIDNNQILKNNITNGMVLETIPQNTDSIQILFDIIQKYTNIESLHIISHGITGALQLGKQVLTMKTLENYTDLKNLKTHFTNNGEILLYGCNIAAYDEGKEFVNILATITGLTITASTSIIGHKNLKGSWELNYSTGISNRSVPINEYAQNNWMDTLTHYRGGNLAWSDEGGNLIKLTVTSYWRHDAHLSLGVLFVPNFTDGGGTITNDIGYVGIDDDGDTTVDEAGDGGGKGTVTSVQIDDGTHLYQINTQIFLVDYSASGAGTYNVTMSSNARISTLQEGAADDPFGLETTVSPGSGQSSPVTSVPAIVKAPVDVAWTYTIPASDPDGGALTYTFADTTAGSGSIYGEWNVIPGMTINLNTGVISLDTTGLTIGHLYSVVILISDGSTIIPVDFIIEIVAAIELPIISSGDLDICTFAGMTYNYIFTATLQSDPTTVITWAVLSAVPPNGIIDLSVQNQLALTFSPKLDQVGNVYIINLSATDTATGAVVYLNVTFTVKQAYIDDIINIFNCSIKDVTVQCERLNSLERILCLKEKENKIWKTGKEKEKYIKDKFSKK